MVVRYIAHPVRPLSGESLDANIEKALRWLEWALRRWPKDAAIAPWISECQLFDEADELVREAGLRRCEAVVARCDELILCGGRISSGMARERKVADYEGLNVVDMSELVEPPRSEA
jgi:hypothetical protein